jgi:PKD repeat protein
LLTQYEVKSYDNYCSGFIFDKGAANSGGHSIPMKNIPRSLRQFHRAAFTALIVLSGITCAPNFGQAAGNSKLPRGLNLGRRAHGEDAIALLGAKLPDVAVAYGVQPAELRDLLKKHHAMWVDQEGSLLYLCEGLSVSHTDNAIAGSVVVGGAPQAATTTPASTFSLHSTPGATRVIYLDFTGHVTSGTSWNSAFTGGAAITSLAFDLDGNPSSFSETECAFIYRVWQRVAEDFAPFAVDVTTEEPAADALRYSGSGDNAYGQRVVISPTNWYSANAGGVSYIGSFNWSSDTPNFVFTQQLANGEKYIAEAISHETGHSLGLNHEGLSGSAPTEYYAGHGDWAPIMGNSYYRPVTQWCKGEYLSANNTQDQLALMQSYGAPLIANLYGSTLASATPLAGPDFTVAGTIVTRVDGDVFRFNTGAGAISLNVANLTPEPNMNIGFQLLNASGALLQTGIASARSVTIATDVPSGTYYLKISGLGSGDPQTNGYSNYASLGNYVLTGSLVPTNANQAPLAIASAASTTGVLSVPINFSSAGSVDSDGSIVSYRWTFGDGGISTEANPDHTYSDVGTYTALLTVTDDGGLATSASVSIQVTLPSNQTPVAVAGGAPTNGIAPLPVAFSSSGSFDPDGTISAYRWEFGDGTSSTLASPTKTYSVAGNYTARLTVTDEQGASSSAIVLISAGAPPAFVNPDTDVDIAQFTLTSSTAPNGTTASATIVVLDRLGRAAAGITINVKWSGLVSNSATGTTDAAGKVVLTSGRSKKKGTATATITTVSPPAGVKFDPAIYGEPMVRSIGFN